MENRNLKKYIKSNCITSEKIKINLSQSKNKIIDLKLPQLQNILKRHFRKKKKKDSKRKSYNFPHSARELKTELIQLKNKTLSDTSLGNLNHTLEYSGYNTSFNEKSLINHKIENKNYSLYPFNKSLTKTKINKSNDSSFFNNNLNLHKPKKTIINIYNTSVKTSPKIFLLSSYINSSTSCHNTTPSNKKTPRNNILNLKLNSKKNNFPISLNSNYINVNSFSEKNNIKQHNRKLETFTNFPINKRYMIDIKDKELSSIINDDILNKSNRNKSFELNNTINDIENQCFLNNKNEDINEELRNKYINKLSIQNDENSKQIELQKDLIINSCNKIRKRIDLIFKKKQSKKKTPCIKEIISHFYKILFKERKYFQRVENYLIKKILYPETNKINLIPKSISDNFLNDLEDLTYEMATSFILGGNIIERHYINRYAFRKTNTMKSIMRRVKLSQENLFFVLEKYIKNDVIIHENPFEIENYKKKVETINYKIRKKKGKKIIKPSSKNYSLLNNIRTSTKLLTRKCLLKNREKTLILLQRRNSYIRQLKFRPSSKVSNIKFNINDQQLVMTKAKDMSKEHLIFRTEEIKIGLKKKLRTIEEILFFLIRENNFREFKEIQERYHISLESRNENKDTFLIYATQCGNENFVQFLIDKGANLNAQNEQLNTALHYALNFKKYNIADLLLKAGASEIILNKYNLTPWEFN